MEKYAKIEHVLISNQPASDKMKNIESLFENVEKDRTELER